MKGLLVVTVLVVLATAYAVEQGAASEDNKVLDTPAVSPENAQDVGKHHHPDHHNHDWDHHNHHDDHNNNHHHHHDDHNNDHHHHDDNDNQQPDTANLCAAARADRWHLPYPKDTHKFVKCDLTTGKGTVFTCPSGLVFNPAIQVCAYA